MAENVTHGIAIFVACYVVKYRDSWQKIRKNLNSNLIISMNNDNFIVTLFWDIESWKLMIFAIVLDFHHLSQAILGKKIKIKEIAP